MSLKLINEGLGQEVVNQYNIETTIEESFREHLDPNLFRNIDYNKSYKSYINNGSLNGYVGIPLSDIKEKYPKNFKFVGQVTNFNTYPWTCRFKLDINKILKQFINNQFDLNRTIVVFDKYSIFSSYLTEQIISYVIKEKDMIDKELFTYLITDIFRRKGFSCHDDSNSYPSSWLELSKDGISYQLSFSKFERVIEIEVYITSDIWFVNNSYSIEELKNGRANIFNLITEQVDKISKDLLEIFDCINYAVDLKNKKTTVSFN